MSSGSRAFLLVLGSLSVFAMTSATFKVWLCVASTSFRRALMGSKKEPWKNGAMVSPQRVGFSVDLQKSRTLGLGDFNMFWVFERAFLKMESMVLVLVLVWVGNGEGEGAIMLLMAWVDRRRNERDTVKRR